MGVRGGLSESWWIGLHWASVGRQAVIASSHAAASLDQQEGIMVPVTALD
jgi:hypothetical protein